jgi:hypothetical protein
VKLRARCFRRNGTERAIDGEPAQGADLYAHQFVNMSQGDVAYIEVLAPKKHPTAWILWRVECLVTNQAYVTKLASPADFQDELTRAGRYYE